MSSAPSPIAAPCATKSSASSIVFSSESLSCALAVPALMIPAMSAAA